MPSSPLRTFFRALCSLRLAVGLIVAFGLALTLATLLESRYDTAVAQYWVYRSPAFHALLGLLGLNILCVALSRLPWRRRHLPFLLAHAGILLLLVGAFITQRYGLDANLTLSEGETSGEVETGALLLVVKDRDGTSENEMKWLPPGMGFDPFPLPRLGLSVDRFLTHAEAKQGFEPANETDGEGARAAPAIELELRGGPMRIEQRFWLWGGDPAWSSVSMGPARFDWVSSGNRALFESLPRPEGQAQLSLLLDRERGIEWRAVSVRGEKKRGRVPPSRIEGAEILPGWKGLRLRILKWLPDARFSSEFVPARIQFGDQAPPPAVRIRRGTESFWLGYGEEARIGRGEEASSVAFVSRRHALPFAVRLERFLIEHYPGSRDPASYSSVVRVIDGDATSEEITIAMNEPLEWKGFTFYQSSYIPEIPRARTSIFTVNRDPGRWVKYAGSALLVLGSILLFAMKALRKRAKSR